MSRHYYLFSSNNKPSTVLLLLLNKEVFSFGSSFFTEKMSNQLILRNDKLCLIKFVTFYASQVNFFFRLFAVLFLTAWTSTNAFSDCDTGHYELTTNQQVTVNSPNFPYGVSNPDSCQFTVVAPIYHVLTVSCYIYLGVKTVFYEQKHVDTIKKN